LKNKWKEDLEETSERFKGFGGVASEVFRTLGEGLLEESPDGNN
jgi:hypothetical protein